MSFYVTLLVVTLIEIFLTHNIPWFFLAFIICFIDRCIFTSRLLGAMVNVRYLCYTEAFSFGTLVILNLLSKKANDYIGWIIYFVLSAVCCTVMIIDDTFFLYITEDLKEENEDEVY